MSIICKFFSLLVSFGIIFILTGCNSLKNTAISLPGTDELIESITGGLVNTQINHAYPVASWFDEVPVNGKARDVLSFDLGPGYYRLKVQSYCLRAGLYGPDANKGHLLAPHTGRRGKMVESILIRSAEHPEIPQRDIQRLLWGIESGISNSEIPLDFQDRVQPLLNGNNIQAMNIDWIKIAKIASKFVLPEEVKKGIEFYEDLRHKIADFRLAFDRIEQLAVLTGAAPLGIGSRIVKPGQWAYAGNGFYARTFPESYSTTAVEVYRPEPYELKRDKIGRVTLLESRGMRVELAYHAASQRDFVLLPNGQKGHIWHLKSLKLTYPQSSNGLVLKNPGWIIASDNSENVIAGIGPHDFHSGLLAFKDNDSLTPSEKSILNDAQWQNQIKEIAKEFYQRVKTVHGVVNKAQNIYDQTKRMAQPPNEQAVRDAYDAAFVNDGIKNAPNALAAKEKIEWIGEQVGSRNKTFVNFIKEGYRKVQQSLQYALGWVAGDLPPPDTRFGRKKHRFDPSGLVAIPGNTRRQPLGLSARIAH